MTGASELDRIIGRVRALGGLPSEVAKAAAPLVAEVVQTSASAGTTPAGQVWAAKKSGGRALANAASAVAARAIGEVVQLRLEGTATGSAKVQAIQNARRNILPPKGEGIPPVIASALERAARDVFDRLVRGRP